MELELPRVLRLIWSALSFPSFDTFQRAGTPEG
jgi:hypothetical protein